MEFIKKDIKLFIISGHARSGKGEVSRLIKEYYKDKKVVVISFGYYLKYYASMISDWDLSEDTKPRALLQNLGIELIKNKIDNKLLINRILQDIIVFSYFCDIIIVNDARLIDEVETLKAMYPNSTSIRVNRNNYNNGLTVNENNHITETALDNYNKFDYTIFNDDNLNISLFKILDEVNV